VSTLRVWYAHFDVENALAVNAATMTLYGRMFGWAPARAHARTGDRVASPPTSGVGRLRPGVAEFAGTCAHRDEIDHAALSAAVAAGRVPAQLAI
jgi:Uncharacterized protein conserved in bacteria (DUF2252)